MNSLRPCFKALSRGSAPQRRFVSSQQVFGAPRAQGQIRVNLESDKVMGISQSRGESLEQEDTFAVGSLDLPTRELRKNLRDSDNTDAVSWRPHRPGDREPTTQQVTYLGVFDGHGGKQTSQALQANLHHILETCSPIDCAELIEWYRKLGGFFKRYKGGSLSRIALEGDDTAENVWRFGFGLDQRATLGFLEADRQVFESPETGKSGSVGTVALLHGLDFPAAPIFTSSLCALTIAHVGDTRAILVARDGTHQRLTPTHHPQSVKETMRLQRSATGLVTDSFGEVRLGGVLANSRSFGDIKFKRLGVYAEPSITKHVLSGPDYACLVLVSDGISGAMTDGEVADLMRSRGTPTQAAQAIVRFAEEIGSEDNMTAIVLPFAGWGRMTGPDRSEKHRAYRVKLAEDTRRSRRM